MLMCGIVSSVSAMTAPSVSRRRGRRGVRGRRSPAPTRNENTDARAGEPHPDPVIKQPHYLGLDPAWNIGQFHLQFIANVQTAIWFQHGTRDGHIVKPPPKRPALDENRDFCIHIRTRKITLPLKSSALGMCAFSNQAI